ncbi:arylsulfatase I-like, partial [Stegodyphus dumicola]|uniref:arylsulfatase I-like n=1 Tax=Stegodyphus dumicola TaxID=202533 RepID=UPI0015AA18EC
QFSGIDLHNGTTLVRGHRGEYATHLFTQVATDIIRNHNTSKPLFLYLAEIAPHTGNFHNPLQAPLEIIKKFSYIKHLQRRIYAAMVSALDDSVGSIFKALYEKGILENSIIVFASDNGGEVSVRKNGYASNYPLRGRKRTAFEGGIRVPAVLWSPLLGLRESRTSNQLMHVTDWLPTLYEAAGGNVKDLGTIDGRNMWNALRLNCKSPRRELLHLLDTIYGMSALRIGNLKLINGSVFNKAEEWYGPTGFEDVNPASMDEWVFKDSNVVETILKRTELWLPRSPDTWRREAVLQCNGKQPIKGKECNPAQAPCLFNITSDPCEYHNIAAVYPQMVNTMMEIISALQEVSEPAQKKIIDPKSHPLCHDFGHVEWLEPEYSSTCDFL